MRRPHRTRPLAIASVTVGAASSHSAAVFATNAAVSTSPSPHLVLGVASELHWKLLDVLDAIRLCVHPIQHVRRLLPPSPVNEGYSRVVSTVDCIVAGRSHITRSVLHTHSSCREAHSPAPSAYPA
jgi:hypothetical protein